MTDESKARLDVDRAARAEALLRNELLQEAFGEVEAAFMQKWFASPEADWKGREAIFQHVMALRTVKGMLAKWVQDGVIAAHDLKFLAEK